MEPGTWDTGYFSDGSEPRGYEVSGAGLSDTTLHNPRAYRVGAPSDSGEYLSYELVAEFDDVAAGEAWSFQLELFPGERILLTAGSDPNTYDDLLLATGDPYDEAHRTIPASDGASFEIYLQQHDSELDEGFVTVGAATIELAATDPVATAHHDASAYTSGEPLVVSGSFEHDGELLNLLWRPQVPEAWSLGEVAADGAVDVVNDEIVWIGADLPDSPIEVTYEVDVPADAEGEQELRNEVEAHFEGDSEPTAFHAGPDPLLISPVEVGDATVVGRHVFYNDSSFDGGDVAPGPHNDAAIAPEKQALQPGQQATAANITNATQGVTGIMLDIADAPEIEAITEDALSFRVGNSSDIEAWTSAPAPEHIHVREGAGEGNADRIELIWPDHAIENQWLKVTVKANDVAGLDADEVFYFGHRTGDVTGDGRVTAEDINLVRQNQTGFGSAGIDNAFDINRTSRVDLGDVIAARNNQDTEPLELIQLPAEAAPADTNPTMANARPATALPPSSSTPTALLDRPYVHTGWEHDTGGPNRIDAPALLEQRHAATSLLDSAFDRESELRQSNWDHPLTGSAIFGVSGLELGLDEREEKEDTSLRLL